MKSTPGMMTMQDHFNTLKEQGIISKEIKLWKKSVLFVKKSLNQILVIKYIVVSIVEKYITKKYIIISQKEFLI